jgi:hypothetical protein
MPRPSSSRTVLTVSSPDAIRTTLCGTNKTVYGQQTCGNSGALGRAPLPAYGSTARAPTIERNLSSSVTLVITSRGPYPKQKGKDRLYPLRSTSHATSWRLGGNRLPSGQETARAQLARSSLPSPPSASQRR